MKNLLIVSALAIVAIGCQSKGTKTNTEDKKAEKEVKVVDASALKIAFYVEDSLTTGFSYYKEQKEMLEKKEDAFQKKIMQMQKDLESYGKSFETKYRNNELAPLQIEQYQKQIQQKQMDMYNYQQTEGAKLEKETFEGTKALLDKIDAYGKEFSELNGYNILFAKKVAGQLIFADDAFDVTADFIEFINGKEEDIKNELK